MDKHHHYDYRDYYYTVGYGCGLPLARLYSQYFGGGLDVKSMEGFGTDSYCHLNWLGNNCENLPLGVTSSPAERDSSLY